MSLYRLVNIVPFSSWVSEKIINEERIDGYYYDYEFIEFEEKLKETGLKVLELGDIFKDITDGDHEKREYTNSGIPFYSVKDIREFDINENNELFINEVDHERLKRSQLNPSNLLITKTGRLGTTAIVPKNIKEGNISADVAILKGKKILIDEHYLGAYLNCKYGELSILRLNYGSTRPRITLRDIPKIKVPVTSQEIQNYIGDKVRKAEELREESKKSKKKYECIIKDIYCDTDAKKFPSGIYFVNNYDFDEKSLRIDSNFYHPLYNYENIKCKHIIKLSELAKLKKNSKIMAKEEYIYYEIGDLSTSKVLEDKERIMGSKLPGRAKLELRMNDIIISLVQESIEVTSYVDMKLKNALTTNGCAVLEPKDKSLSAYLYAIMSSEFFIAQKCKYISGTNIRSMSKDDLLDMSIPIVEQKIIDKIVELVNIEFSNIRKAKQLIQEAKQDVEDLIEGKFDMAKLNETTTESR